LIIKIQRDAEHDERDGQVHDEQTRWTEIQAYRIENFQVVEHVELHIGDFPQSGYIDQTDFAAMQIDQSIEFKFA